MPFDEAARNFMSLTDLLEPRGRIVRTARKTQMHMAGMVLAATLAVASPAEAANPPPAAPAAIAAPADPLAPVVPIPVPAPAPPTQAWITLGSAAFFGATLRGLTVLFVLALLLESALSVIFNWRLFLEFFYGRGVRTLVMIAVSAIAVRTFQIDTVTTMLQGYWRRSSTPPSSGWTGSTTCASSSRSATCHRPRQRRATMLRAMLQPWPRNPNQSASGIPRAVHSRLAPRLAARMGRHTARCGSQPQGLLRDRISDRMALVTRLLHQTPKAPNKIYALHELGVDCIAITLAEGFVVSMRSIPGNPYGGHTLAETLQADTEAGQVPAPPPRHRTRDRPHEI